MTISVQHLIETFDQLPAAEQREAAVAILRRTLEDDLPPLSDDDLVSAAEALFLELDAREAAHGQP